MRAMWARGTGELYALTNSLGLRTYWCQYDLSCAAYENIEITTHSRPDAFPSALRQKLRKTQTKVHEGDDGLLKVSCKHSAFTALLMSCARQVSEKCPACGHAEAYSKELQLRSADEGSTILYTVRTFNLCPSTSSRISFHIGRSALLASMAGA